MRLANIKYSEFPGDPRSWYLEKAKLSHTNLFVGKNASGKTRILNLINNLSAMISGRIPPMISAHYQATFKLGKEALSYEICMREGKVISEVYKRGNRVLIDRNEEGHGFIFAEKIEGPLELGVSSSDIVAVSRRDSVQHPFLEPLHDWASSVRHIAFGSELGKRNAWLVPSTLSGLEANLDVEGSDLSPERTSELYSRTWAQFREQYDEEILLILKEIGYDCVAVGSAPLSIPGIPSNALMLFVQERDLEAETRQLDMSQGMYRALVVAVHIGRILLIDAPSTLLIDDIGEGLDFDRSSRLVRYLVDRCSNSPVQLVMSSNDRFVMNYVDLRHWHVVVRDGQKVKTLDYSNNRAKFDSFRSIGLNNFDFFARGIYLEDGVSS